VPRQASDRSTVVCRRRPVGPQPRRTSPPHPPGRSNQPSAAWVSFGATHSEGETRNRNGAGRSVQPLDLVPAAASGPHGASTCAGTGRESCRRPRGPGAPEVLEGVPAAGGGRGSRPTPGGTGGSPPRGCLEPPVRPPRRPARRPGSATRAWACAPGGRRAATGPRAPCSRSQGSAVVRHGYTTQAAVPRMAGLDGTVGW